MLRTQPARRWMAAVVLLLGAAAAHADWLNWRGPQQNGVSDLKGLPDTWQPGGANHLWTLDLHGRGTPVIHGQKAYVLGYVGSGADVRETLVALDVATGKILWQRFYSDFLSDVIYDRYSIGAPVVDPQSGHVFIHTSPGILVALSPDGKELWQNSMMETLGRLTFPNGRTGAPVLFENLVIVHSITSNWGRDTPARDRFYAFDKTSGELVWSSTPGVGAPYLKDSSYSTPIVEIRDGRALLYAGTGCGNLVCIDARTGEPLWRYQMAIGGVNVAPVIFGDTVIALHDVENVDESTTGRMVAVKLGTLPPAGKPGPVELTREHEAWRANVGSFSSSPTLVGDRVYVCTLTGELVSVNARDGSILWKQKLATSQLHASPLYADGKLYVPFQNGQFFIVRPTDQSPQVLAEVALPGSALGAPSVSDGRIFLHTTEKLYCFGNPGASSGSEPAATWMSGQAQPGTAAVLQVVPSEFLLRPGQRQALTLVTLDKLGRRVGTVQGGTWEHAIPPGALVRAQIDGTFEGDAVVAGPQAKLSAGSMKTQASGFSGTTRGRIMPNPPFSEDFESFELNQTGPDGVKSAVPPLPWIGARGKWVVVERDGNRVLKKTLDNILFQRAMTFIGHPDESGLTVEADVMSDGNRRMMSVVGVINQRYIIALIGNAQILEVSSNHERVKMHVPFKWQPGMWYRLKTRVDVAADGVGTIRAKAWKKGDPEPEAWTLEVTHAHAHAHGSPGFFGFSPGSQFPVYLDNLVVKKEEAK